MLVIQTFFSLTQGLRDTQREIVQNTTLPYEKGAINDHTLSEQERPRLPSKV